MSIFGNLAHTWICSLTAAEISLDTLELRTRFFGITARSRSFGMPHRRNTKIRMQCLNDAARCVAAAVRYLTTRRAVNICRRNSMTFCIKKKKNPASLFGGTVRSNSFASHFQISRNAFAPACHCDRWRIKAQFNFGIADYDWQVLTYYPEW